MMGLTPQNIGKTMNHGYAGSYARQPDMIVNTRPAGGSDHILFGAPLQYDDAGNVFGHWVTGETFSFEAWCEDEPSRVDLDGTEEWYIMLWNIPSLGGWTWNDQRNDPLAAVATMDQYMGFICEYEE